jgi:hypothetical protein
LGNAMCYLSKQGVDIIGKEVAVLSYSLILLLKQVNYLPF